jgi:hypothetical protein
MQPQKNHGAQTQVRTAELDQSVAEWPALLALREFRGSKPGDGHPRRVMVEREAHYDQVLLEHKQFLQCGPQNPPSQLENYFDSHRNPGVPTKEADHRGAGILRDESVKMDEQYHEECSLAEHRLQQEVDELEMLMDTKQNWDDKQKQDASQNDLQNETSEGIPDEKIDKVLVKVKETDETRHGVEPDEEELHEYHQLRVRSEQLDNQTKAISKVEIGRNQ